jgi:hypothetical protein
VPGTRASPSLRCVGAWNWVGEPVAQRCRAATFGQWRSHGRCCRLVLTSAALATPVAHPWQPHEPITTRRRCWPSWRREPQSDMRVATYLSQIERLHRTVDLCRTAGVKLSHTTWCCSCSAHTLLNPASPPVSCAAALCKLPRQCKRRAARVPWCAPTAQPAPRVGTTMATRRPPAAPGTSAPASRRSTTTVQKCRISLVFRGDQRVSRRVQAGRKRVCPAAGFHYIPHVSHFLRRR